MKLNMIVVMTMWLPRLACSQAGMKAQAAPNSAEASTASKATTGQGQPVSASATSPAPSPPR